MAKSNFIYKKEYDKNKNPIYVEGKSPINHNDEWREKVHEEFSNRYGAWWVFTGNAQIYNGRTTWIDQFRKER